MSAFSYFFPPTGGGFSSELGHTFPLSPVIFLVTLDQSCRPGVTGGDSRILTSPFFIPLSKSVSESCESREDSELVHLPYCKFPCPVSGLRLILGD